MSTKRTTQAIRAHWKTFERKIATFFGARRQIGSGSLNRDDRSCSDSDHEILYIECKCRQNFSVVQVWRDAAIKAKKENKTPVVALREFGGTGDFLLLKKEDLELIYQEWKKVTIENLLGDE